MAQPATSIPTAAADGATLVALLCELSHLPTTPTEVWTAEVRQPTSHTCEYTNYSDRQLLSQLRQLESDSSYPFRETIQKVRSCVQFCVETLRRYGVTHAAFSFNGGKDCTVLLHLLRLAFQQMKEEAETEAEDAHTDGTPSSIPPLSSLICIYFKEPNEFNEICQFMQNMRDLYHLRLEEISGSYKEALVDLQKKEPIEAIFMGQRRGDPGCTLETISPSDAGWPKFDRVNALLDWTYHDIWIFLREFKLPYCPLYDHGYTSLGHRFNTIPNSALLIDTSRSDEPVDPSAAAEGVGGSVSSIPSYLPAWRLVDAARERDGRLSTKQQQIDATILSPVPGVGATTPSPPVTSTTQQTILQSKLPG